MRCKSFFKRADCPQYPEFLKTEGRKKYGLSLQVNMVFIEYLYLVCIFIILHFRALKEFAEVPRYWTNALVRIHRDNIVEIMVSERIRIVGSVELCHHGVQDFFSFVAQNSDIGLKSLNIDMLGNDLTAVMPDTLAAALARVEKVELAQILGKA